MWTAIIAAIISIVTEVTETALTWVAGSNSIDAEEKAAIDSINAEKDAAITNIKLRISKQNALVIIGTIALIIIVVLITDEKK